MEPGWNIHTHTPKPPFRPQSLNALRPGGEPWGLRFLKLLSQLEGKTPRASHASARPQAERRGWGGAHLAAQEPHLEH